MKQTAVWIEGNAVRLEGAFYEPDAVAAGVLVVCHPHPLRGGDMRNNAVMTVVRTALEEGLAAVAFNFRGVGRSEGIHDDGIGEQDDARDAVAHARGLMPGARLVLAGYSFGGGMAGAIADDSMLGLALVSPAAGRLRDIKGGIATYRGPVLMITGEADTTSQPQHLRDLAAASPAQTEVRTVPNADHFWFGHETKLADALSAFFRRLLAQGN